MTDYTAILDVYTIQDILEQNDITEEEALDYLVTQGFLTLPEIEPLEFNDD